MKLLNFNIILFALVMMSTIGCRNYIELTTVTNIQDQSDFQKDVVYLKVADDGFLLYCIPDLPRAMQNELKDIFASRSLEQLGAPLFLHAKIMVRNGEIISEWLPDAITEMPIKYTFDGKVYYGRIESEIQIAPLGSPDAILIENRLVGKDIPTKQHNFRIPLMLVQNQDTSSLAIPLVEDFGVSMPDGTMIYYSGMIIVR